MGQEWDRVVYVAHDGQETSRWFAHVESYVDDHFEEGPQNGWTTAGEAIAWGKARAPIVLVRAHNQFYSAGEGLAEDDEDTPLPTWPPGVVQSATRYEGTSSSRTASARAVTSRWETVNGRKRRVYKLTAAGKKRLAVSLEEAPDPSRG